MPDTVRGVDLFHGDTGLDFHSMQAAGVGFAYIKASQGVGMTDPAFAGYRARAMSVGMLTGAYHFFTPDDDPIAQAHHLLAAAPVVSGDLIHCLDVETAGDNIGANAKACAAELKRITGKWPAIYSGDSFFQDNLIDYFPPSDYVLWIARYGHAPVTPCVIWQFTDGQRNGNNPPLDTDVFYGSLDDLKTHCYA